VWLTAPIKNPVNRRAWTNSIAVQAIGAETHSGTPATRRAARTNATVATR